MCQLVSHRPVTVETLVCPRPARVGFVVYNMALGHFFLIASVFSQSVSCYQCFILMHSSITCCIIIAIYSPLNGRTLNVCSLRLSLKPSHFPKEASFCICISFENVLKY